jgi:glycosyltransferase involved in cell wall biosynthesis
MQNLQVFAWLIGLSPIRGSLNAYIKKYPNSDFCIFVTFGFNNQYNKIPSLLFHDWTFRILIEDREKRQPSILEKEYIEHENEVLNSADIVLPLFEETCKRFRETHPMANVKKIDLNVINNMCDEPLDECKILAEKLKSKYILFIGRVHYKIGLQTLIQVVEDGGLSDFKIHVIGMDKSDFPDAPESVVFHGFLRKDVPSENKTYYDLMKGARLMINPTPKWGAYSSIVEGMFFYTPVVVSPFVQFVNEFGDNIDFGAYCNECTKEDILSAISLINNQTEEDYKRMCRNAHNKVKSYTWDNYVKKMIEMMNDYLHDRTSH